MEILYLKLRNGIDLVSNSQIEENVVKLQNPMTIRQFADSTGSVAVSFLEWIPMDFIEETIVEIKKEEVLLVANASSKLKTFYHECMVEAVNKRNDAETSDDSDGSAYSDVLRSISNNKKLYH